MGIFSKNNVDVHGGSALQLPMGSRGQRGFYGGEGTIADGDQQRRTSVAQAT
jgi:hypothetical protein